MRLRERRSRASERQSPLNPLQGTIQMAKHLNQFAHLLSPQSGVPFAPSKAARAAAEVRVTAEDILNAGRLARGEIRRPRQASAGVAATAKAIIRAGKIRRNEVGRH